MASATSRRTRVLLRLGVLVRAIAWTFLAAVLALAGAGLVARFGHPAGSPARAELTWLGDVALSSALAASEADVLDVADAVDQLADEARIALASAASGDPALLEASLSRGTIEVASIDAAAAALEATLGSLPGGDPEAALYYRADLVVRRAALLAAVGAASELAGHWSAVKARSTDVAELLRLIDEHDQRVLEAAAEGRAGSYRNAVTILGEAADLLKVIRERRAKLVSGLEPTILDEWIDRNRTYEEALTALYEALRKTSGKVTPAVQAAARNEQIARDQLPADPRAIVVIVSEVARGGLNQAVLAIEETRGRIDAALAPPGG